MQTSRTLKKAKLTKVSIETYSPRQVPYWCLNTNQKPTRGEMKNFHKFVLKDMTKVWFYHKNQITLSPACNYIFASFDQRERVSKHFREVRQGDCVITL